MRTQSREQRNEVIIGSNHTHSLLGLQHTGLFLFHIIIEAGGSLVVDEITSNQIDQNLGFEHVIDTTPKNGAQHKYLNITGHYLELDIHI